MLGSECELELNIGRVRTHLLVWYHRGMCLIQTTVRGTAVESEFRKN